MLPLTHIPLQRLGYEDAYALQQQHHQQILDARSTPAAELGRVLMIEHDPVITVTRRPDAQSHILASEQLLASQGVQLHHTDRGGDVTYHGPGQLVAYPIIDLNAAGLRIHEYIRTLEAAVIATLAQLNIQAHADPKATGVWVNPQHHFKSDQPAKIAAIGVRVRRWITLHGLAINLNPDMSHYKLIVPCGLSGRPVTSIAEILGVRNAPTLQELADILFKHLRARILQRAAVNPAQTD
ncbi:MAG: lipoyl(octanoyl) transferase LipB [Phycisphaerales bacterium]